VLCPPFGQGLPLWVDDPAFDLANHLRAVQVVQVAGDVPLSVAVLSYDGQLNIGIQSDPDGRPDLDVFADGLRRSLDELGAATPLLPG